MASKATREKGAVFFTHAQGRDIPNVSKEPPSKAREYHMTVVNRDNGEARAIKVQVNIYLDSQQPQLHMSKQRCIGLEGRIIFPLQICKLRCGIEGDTTTLGEYISDKYIKEQRAKFAFLEKMLLVTLWQLVPIEQPLIPFLGNGNEEANPMAQSSDQQSKDAIECDANWKWLKSQDFKTLTIDLWGNYKSSYASVGETMNWALYLQEKLCENRRKGWWYYGEQKLIGPKAPKTDASKIGAPKNPKHCPQWLLPVKDQKLSRFHSWPVRAHWFIDDNERRSIMIEGAMKERRTQIAQVLDVYSQNRLHRARLQKLDEMSYHIHVKLGAGIDETEIINASELLPGTPVKFLLLEQDQAREDDEKPSSATVVDAPTDSDLVILVDMPMPERDPENIKPLLVAVHVRPNLMSIDAQLTALHAVSYTTSYGDSPGNIGKGFSLERTLLAHGNELDLTSPYHFKLDGTTMSKLEPRICQERVDHILEVCSLDDNQLKAFLSSVTNIVCGISLIQGPPGTGKTRTSTAIILAFACLGIRVALVAGSNDGVDNLAESVAKTIERDHKIRSWVGEYGIIRLRTPSRQMAEVRVNSAALLARPLAGAHKSEILSKYEMHYRVMSYAKAHPEDGTCKDLLTLVGRDERRPLGQKGRKALKSKYDSIVRRLVDNALIVSTTLMNSGNEDFAWLKYQVLICDESGQCTEGDSLIALKHSHLRAVVLVGDPQQLPPTVISATARNECALYLKRSLMERLQGAGYPHTMLTRNYRNHPHIAEFPNRKVYSGLLRGFETNGVNSRVGHVWDSFTRTLHFFRGSGIEDLRRLFISVNTCATKATNSCSWSNLGQVVAAAALLSALFDFTAPDTGAKILPDDIMIISPYKDQRALIREIFRVHRIQVRENLTVDASQGKEAPFVIFLLTKPSGNAQSVGFVSNAARLNVALTRARDVLVTIGNFVKWDSTVIRDMRTVAEGRDRLLADFLEDCSIKGHTLTWHGENTVRAPAEPSRDDPIPIQFHDEGLRNALAGVDVVDVGADAGADAGGHEVADKMAEGDVDVALKGKIMILVEVVDLKAS
ncbi:P-loop containing nucleoside triphosphate hydrolase protein [Aspergillus germanicus]